MTGKPFNVYIARVPISLPCQIPVFPGTPNADGPLDQRTECCAVDAFWFVGAAPTCDVHLGIFTKLMWNETYEEFVEKFIAENPDYKGRIPNAWEKKPWYDRHRYAEDIVRRETKR